MEPFEIIIENQHDFDYSLNQEKWLDEKIIEIDDDHMLFKATAKTLEDALILVQNFYIQSLAHLDVDKSYIRARLIAEWSGILSHLTELLQLYCIHAEVDDEFDSSHFHDTWGIGNSFGSWTIKAIPVTVQLDVDRTKTHQTIVKDGIRFTITAEEV